MSERFSFAVPDTSIIWNQEIDVNNSLNEHYVTAIDETQYLSVLDSTNEITLEDLTLTPNKLDVVQDFIQNDIINEQEVTHEEEATDASEVVVYSVEGSDDLFGIQTACDEEGNLHKYQFQFRRNDEGQLEAIPETIQLLPNDEEALVETIEPTEETTQMQIFVTEDNGNETIIPDHQAFAESEEIIEGACTAPETYDNHVPEEGQEEGREFPHEEEIDIKPLMSAVKEEDIQVDYDSLSQYAEQEELVAEAEINEEYERNLLGNHMSFDDEEHAIVEENVPFIDHYQPINTEIPESHNSNIEHVEVNPDLDLMQEHHEATDEENEEYDVVEGLHITADTAASFTPEILNTDTNSNILKQALKMNQISDKKDESPLIFYLIQKPEKENVDSLSMGMTNLCRPKINPRSVLKSSHGLLQPLNDYDQYQNKRFFKCKEAQEARSFHSYINKTTIPQAPIRKDRLPRKQKIAPVERQDEEIVVQEVMIGSNGFVEKINKEDLAILDYVNLADSDDEYDPKKNGMRKKNHRRKRTITISDSEDSEENSVIDLIESEEEEDVEDAIISSLASSKIVSKRKRGRPPKNPQSKKQISSDNNTSPKRHKITEDELPIPKPEIPCSKCDKTFPSQNSLKTHLQHHNLQYSLSKAALPLAWKYDCNKCGELFKNQILQKNHSCPTPQTTCTICGKKLKSIEALNIHRRIHLKDHMVKSTTNILELTPKSSSYLRSFNRSSLSKPNWLKCSVCGKICSSVLILNTHLQTHKECTTCSQRFVSELMLEKHLIEKCVKSPRRIVNHNWAKSVGVSMRDRKFTGIPASVKLQKAVRTATNLV